jgi:hypothetical protein
MGTGDRSVGTRADASRSARRTHGSPRGTPAEHALPDDAAGGCWCWLGGPRVCACVLASSWLAVAMTTSSPRAKRTFGKCACTERVRHVWSAKSSSSQACVLLCTRIKSSQAKPSQERTCSESVWPVLSSSQAKSSQSQVKPSHLLREGLAGALISEHEHQLRRRGGSGDDDRREEERVPRDAAEEQLE